ncbi:MAG: MFS transporter [Armatimonadetes bacterium]|nr:MFS transporter [Armatimonadota bacterium]
MSAEAVPKPRLLSHKSFRDLWIGQTISTLGDSVYWLVLLFMAERVSGSAMTVGLVAIFQSIPFMLIGPFAGVYVDRVDRRKILVVFEFMSAAITALLTLYAFFVAMPAVWVLCLTGFLLSAVNVVFAPARSAAIPRLVPENQVGEANAWAMATQQVVLLIGIGLNAAVLGVIYKVMPEKFFFLAALINTISFCFSTYFLSRLPSIIPLRDELEEAAHPLVKIKSDLIEGFQAIKRDDVISVALPMSIIINLTVSGFMLTYIAVNKAWFGGEFGTLAIIELAFVGVNMVFSLIVGKQNIKRVGMAYAFSTIAIGLFIAAFAWSKTILLFMLFNALCGIAFPYLMLPITTYMQLAIPDRLRGRVNGTWGMFASAVQPIGIGITGFLLERFGLEFTFIYMGVGMAFGGAIGLFSRKFRNALMPSPGQAT